MDIGSIASFLMITLIKSEFYEDIMINKITNVIEYLLLKFRFLIVYYHNNG